jgi:hypothetical protein
MRNRVYPKKALGLRAIQFARFPVIAHVLYEVNDHEDEAEQACEGDAKKLRACAARIVQSSDFVG